jgi:RNA polymerase sigma factor FliA
MSISEHRALSLDRVARMLPALQRIAYQLARRLPRHVRVDDLVGAGREGLVSAIARFDPARDEGFEAYAECRIRGAMLDELRASDPLSRDQRAHAQRIAASTRTLGARLGRAPAADEIAADLGISLDTYWEWLAAGATGLTCELDVDDDPATRVHDPQVEPADECLARAELKAAINRAAETLSERSRQFLRLHYVEGRTLRQIGELYGVSESRVSQIMTEAVAHIRSQCHEHITGRRAGSCPPPAPRRPRRAPRRNVAGGLRAGGAPIVNRGMEARGVARAHR